MTVCIAPKPGYPAEILEDCESALILFCAGFLGASDGCYIAEAGLENVVGVDIDSKQLDAMRALYPKTWKFHLDDAFNYARFERAHGWDYDLVSVDPSIGLIPDALADLGLWCSLAKKYVTLTIIEPIPQELGIPEGWKFSQMAKRHNRTHWLVLEKE